MKLKSQCILLIILMLVVPMLPGLSSVSAQITNEANTLPDLGAPAANTGSVEPNMSAQGAGINYRDNINGKLISITPQYNEQNGTSIGVSLAGALTKNMAVGILLSGGSDRNEWLLNTGFDLTSNQRFIFSLGQLRQKQEFNFISGSQKAQVRQDNGAISYQYFLEKNFLNAAEINAYISDTGSMALGDKTYFTETISLYELWSDPRRIAGGRVSGMQGRLVFTPTSKSTLKIGLGGERLTYDLLTGNDSTTRATGSAEFNQRLDYGINLRASANAGASQSRYALGVGKSFMGGSQFGLDLATIKGRDNNFNDNQLLLSYTQSFGSNNASHFGSTNNTASNNLDATGAPMNQAYANPEMANIVTPNSTTNTWTSSLVDQVSRRPSFLPSQVIAKIDTTAAPTRLIAIDKTSIPVGSSVATATGILTVPIGAAVSVIANVTLNSAAFTNSGQFILSGSNHLVINPNLMMQPSATDTYVVTMNNSEGGGTTLATVKVSRASIKIDSVLITFALPSGYITQGGLIWAPITSSVTRNWATINGTPEDYCSALTSLSYLVGSWRTPTISELLSLYAGRNSNISPSGWAPIGWNLDLTYSSDNNGSGRYSYIDLSNGVSSTSNYGYNMQVSCVHPQ
jgi:hypothetical protein